MTQITIKDLAAKLNISTSTVSRALNNHPDINKKTKAAVNKIASDLGYEPNIIARNLKSQRSNQIGVIVPEIKHDFFSKVISGIEDVAYKNGYTVVVAQSNEDVEREKLNINSLYHNRIAGILISISQSAKDVKHLQALQAKGIKIVQFDRTNDKLKCSKIIVDDSLASYDAVNLLVKKGRKNILHLAGPQNLNNAKNRLLGYKKALAENKIRFSNKLVMKGGMHEEDGELQINMAIKNNLKFDAIFAVNDPVAIGASIALKNNGAKIPEDVAIIGFSNNPITEFVTPSLSTIEQPAYEMGKAAVIELINQIEKESLKEKEIILPTKLIIRESI